MAIQRFKAKITSGANFGKPLVVIDYEKVARFITNMELPEDITKKLLHRARTVPQGSLRHFIDNINLHISNFGGQTEKKVEDVKDEQT